MTLCKPKASMPLDNQTAMATNPSTSTVGNANAFEHIEQGFPLLQSKDVKQKLLQWNLDHSLQVQRFRVGRKITKENEHDLINAFFRDSGVQRRLNLPKALLANATDNKPLRIQRLRTTVTSLSFFGKLVDAKLVSESGALRRCLDDVFDGATASDLLKESLINPESESVDVFTDEEQQELIFHVFRALVIGGSMCQPDDWLAPYEDMTKQFYKALVSVKKNAADKRAIDITSHVFMVEDTSVFDSASRFNSCFVALDAKKRWFTVWHNTFRAFW